MKALDPGILPGPARLRQKAWFFPKPPPPAAAGTSVCIVHFRTCASRQARDHRDQLLGVDRLADMFLVSRVQGAGPVLTARQGRQGDGRDTTRVPWEGPHLLDQLVAILLGHADVADEDVQYGAGGGGKCFSRRAGRHDLSATLFEYAARQCPCVVLVINNEYSQPCQGVVACIG